MESKDRRSGLSPLIHKMTIAKVESGSSDLDSGSNPRLADRREVEY